MDGPQLSIALDQLAPFYAQAVASFIGPASKERIAALEKAVEAGEFGPAANVLAPAISKVRENVDKQVEVRRAIIARLEQAANP
jgi:hypothetical protein